MTLEHLNQVNEMPVYSVTDPVFFSYGRIVTGYDFSEFVSYIEARSVIPEEGNIYIASVPELERLPAAICVRNALYGGMPVQIGYCNGRNTTFNGFEYHKGSEINIAVTDFMLVLGHVWDITENTFCVENAQIFFVQKGTAIEMYQTTLHLSPCRVTDEGFKDIVILPEGTNTPLTCRSKSTDPESRFLLQTNKWVLSHPDREPLIRQGAFPGVLGENKELHY